MINLLISSIILMVVTIVISYIYIGKYIYKFKRIFVQPLLKDGPNHKKKRGTPTMGGLAVISIYVIIMLILTILSNFLDLQFDYFTVFIVLFVTIGYFLIGLVDDVNKIKYKKNDKGLKPKEKLILQLCVSVLVIVALYFNHATTNIILYSINQSLNIGIFYYLLIPFLFLAITNATNLTDGLDGLLAINAIITISFLTYIALMNKNTTLVISNIIFISTLISFYIYNKYPAKVFLGDVGSLAIGGYITMEALLLKVEVLLFFFVVIYFIETISVMLQVGYFKYTKKKHGEGKRLLLMAPYHHHLEKKGLKEKQIVKIFGFVNIICCIVGIIIYVM